MESMMIWMPIAMALKQFRFSVLAYMRSANKKILGNETRCR